VHGATRRTLLKIKGFSEIKVEKIKEAIQKCLVRVYSTLVKMFKKITDKLFGAGPSQLQMVSSQPWNFVINERKSSRSRLAVSNLTVSLEGKSVYNKE
jgi:urate oxidase